MLSFEEDKSKIRVKLERATLGLKIPQGDSPLVFTSEVKQIEEIHEFHQVHF
jgi:hypothetical protein